MARTKSQSSVVCDAGPLIHLDELNQLDLIEDFSKVFITNTLWNEVQKYRSIDFSEALFEVIADPPIDAQLTTISRAFLSTSLRNLDNSNSS